MLNVVLDTNVIVSAILSPGGNPSLILNDVLSGKHLFYYTASILAEYKEVLSRPEFSFDPKRVQLTLDPLSERGILEIPPRSNIPLPDETDRMFYDLAFFVEAFLVIGNLKHYPPDAFVITPAQIMLVINQNAR
jgi:putative PIN family toxin of toxin-antitoxin system